MSEPESEPQALQWEEPQPPGHIPSTTPVLNYRTTTPENYLVPQTSTGLQALIGFLSWIAALGLCLLTVRATHGEHVVTVVIVELTLVIGLCVWFQAQLRWHGFIPGLLIGFMMTCLIPLGVLAVVC